VHAYLEHFTSEEASKIDWYVAPARADLHHKLCIKRLFLEKLRKSNWGPTRRSKSLFLKREKGQMGLQQSFKKSKAYIKKHG
jgi:hypothetical protein